MAERTLRELSDASKAHFEAREYQDAANLLVEARDRFPQDNGRKLVQDGDGSIVVEFDEDHPRLPGTKRTVRKPVE